MSSHNDDDDDEEMIEENNDDDDDEEKIEWQFPPVFPVFPAIRLNSSQKELSTETLEFVPRLQKGFQTNLQ